MNIYFGFKKKEKKQARKEFCFNNAIIKICISETTLPASG